MNNNRYLVFVSATGSSMLLVTEDLTSWERLYGDDRFIKVGTPSFCKANCSLDAFATWDKAARVSGITSETNVSDLYKFMVANATVNPLKANLYSQNFTNLWYNTTVEVGVRPATTSTTKDQTMNTQIIAQLALSATKDATTDASRIPEGPLRQAFEDAQTEREAQRRKQLGNEILGLIETYDASVAHHRSSIRSLKTQLDREYAQVKKLETAYTYGMETANFVPFLVELGHCRPRDVTIEEWERLSVIPQVGG